MNSFFIKNTPHHKLPLDFNLYITLRQYSMYKLTLLFIKTLNDVVSIISRFIVRTIIFQSTLIFTKDYIQNIESYFTNSE